METKANHKFQKEELVSKVDYLIKYFLVLSPLPYRHDKNTPP